MSDTPIRTPFFCIAASQCQITRAALHELRGRPSLCKKRPGGKGNQPPDPTALRVLLSCAL